MPKQTPGTSSSAPEQSANHMMNFIKMLALFDLHHMVEAMQGLFPFPAAIPGLDLARLTKIEEEYFADIANASTNVQQRISATTAEQSKMLQECISDTLRSLHKMSLSGDPNEVAAKQTELVAQIMEKLSSETMALIERHSEVMMDILADLKDGYVKALTEIKEMAEASKS